MGRLIRVSVPRGVLSSENPVRQEYLSTIADMDLSIELSRQIHREDMDHSDRFLMKNCTTNPR